MSLVSNINGRLRVHFQWTSPVHVQWSRDIGIRIILPFLTTFSHFRTICFLGNKNRKKNTTAFSFDTVRALVVPYLETSSFLPASHYIFIGDRLKCLKIEKKKIIWLIAQWNFFYRENNFIAILSSYVCRGF